MKLQLVDLRFLKNLDLLGYENLNEKFVQRIVIILKCDRPGKF